MSKVIPYGRQEITAEDIAAVTDALQGDFLTQGPKISSFEEQFCKVIGSPHAVAVSNGTAALHLGVKALGLEKGEKVVTSPLTFSASANSILYNQGEVVFCDIDESTGLMDLNHLELIVKSEDIRGVIPVDYAGLVVDTKKIRSIVGEDIWILEDACHAPGGYFTDDEGNQSPAGSCQYADAAIFSFHPVKHIAAGEGGMITFKDTAKAEQAALLRTHGITKDPALLNKNHGGWYYEMHELGFNYRLTDIQAALGNSQLSRLDQSLIKRRAIANRYDQVLSRLSIQLPAKNEGHAYHLYVIRTDSRRELYDFLISKNIRVQVHYIPVHTLPYYQSLGFTPGQFPKSEKFYNECLSLPMFPTLTEEDQGYVIQQVENFFS